MYMYIHGHNAMYRLYMHMYNTMPCTDSVEMRPTFVVAMELTNEACWKPWLLAVTATSQRGLKDS